MKKLSKWIWPVLMLCLVILLAHTVVNTFDKEEAENAFGKVYSLTEGWMMTDAEGNSKEVTLPIYIPYDKAATITFSHEMSEDYTGLALSTEATNAKARVLVDGIPVYGGGGRRDDKNAKNSQEENNGKTTAGAADMAEDADSTDVNSDAEISENTDDNKEEGKLVISLPEQAKSGNIEITLTQVNNRKGITMSDVTIAKRDVAVIHSIQSSAFIIVCGILMGIAAVVILVIDGLQFVNHQKGRKGGYAVLMTLTMIIYHWAAMDVLFLMMDNQWFLEHIRIMALALSTPLLILFYKEQVERYFRKRVNGLLYVSLLVILLTSILQKQNVISYFDYYDLILTIVQMVSFLLLLAMLCHIRIKKYVTFIWWEVAGFVLLIGADVINLGGWIGFSTGWEKVIMVVAHTAFFIFVAVQQVVIMIQINRQAAKERQEQLEEQNRQLEAAKQEALLANEAKGKFLANMSHEIRTPINAVLGMDEMILRESREKSIREYAMDIFTSGQMLLSLINDILDFSKIESGKMEIVPVEYDLSSMIHDLVNMISVRTKAKNLELVIQVQEDLASRLYGDDVRIRQILTNILTNAAKYTNEGTVWFRVSGHREGEKQLLHFEVEDTGIGIKEEDLPKLFEDFARIEEKRNRNIEGTGLGMNITVELLALMGSKLEVGSVYGKGSTFSFDLLQEIKDETPIGNFEERVKQAAEEYSYTESFIAPGAKVLVVDDNATNRRVFLSLLKATQIQIEEAAGGKEAVEKAAANRYDIIFMDHMMPEMDGVEAMKAIRKDQKSVCQNTKIYVLTANAVTGARENYLKEGFDGFVSKPIVSRKLEEAIREALPRELLLAAPVDEDETKLQTQEAPEFPMVDGIDWEVAWMHLSDEQLLKDTLRDFYEMLPVHGKNLDEMLKRFPSEEAVEEYRILVHAMKGLSAMLGIFTLAGMAKVLEYAAHDKELETIYAIHSIFLKEWYAYEEKLRGIFGLGEETDEEKPQYESAKVKAYFNLLKQALEEMEVDEADRLVKELSDYAYPPKILTKIKELHQAVTGLDEEKADDIMDEILSQL